MKKTTRKIEMFGKVVTTKIEEKTIIILPKSKISN